MQEPRILSDLERKLRDLGLEFAEQLKFYLMSKGLHEVNWKKLENWFWDWCIARARIQENVPKVAEKLLKDLEKLDF